MSAGMRAEQMVCLMADSTVERMGAMKVVETGAVRAAKRVAKMAAKMVDKKDRMMEWPMVDGKEFEKDDLMAFEKVGVSADKTVLLTAQQQADLMVVMSTEWWAFLLDV